MGNQPYAGLLSMPGSRVVIVGTAEHGAGSPLPAVPSVVATARDLGQVLMDRCGLHPANLVTVLNPEAPQRVHDVLTIAGEQATDTLALFFTGHGLIGPDHELYLATAATRDLTRGSPVFQAFPYAVLRELVGQCRARSVLVVLDCCFSGLAHGLTRRVVDTLADTAQLSGFSLLASAGSDELAWAPTDDEHTAFGGELIRLLREGDPDAGDTLTVDAVYRSLTTRLAERGFPRPYQQNSDGAGQWPLAPNPVSPAAEPGPYRGLAFFRQEDAGYYFGRDELVADLVDRLGTHLGDGGPLVVTGSSGSGKSSLLRAGLIPALARMDLRSPGSSRWAARVLTPGADPFGQLAMWLAAPAGLPILELRERLRHDPAELATVLGTTCERTGEHVLLVVDQFEELFTACEEEPTRQAFVAALAAAGGQGSAVVLLSLRAGFFGQCAQHPELVPALERALVVTPMSPDQLREVIEKPARKAGLALEDGLVDLLLADLGDTETSGVSLPLLSHALLTTWQHRRGNLLTLSGYHATGGIQRAVARTADTLFDRLDETGRAVARRLLVRLVRIGDGTGDTRRRLPLSEVLVFSAAETSVVQYVLDQLARERLIRIDRDTGKPVEFVEIAHDALLRAWPRLQKWINVDRAGLLVRQQLAESAITWDRHGRDPEYLYSGSRLAEVHAWLRERAQDKALGPTESAFIEASRRRRRMASRRRRLSVLGLVVLLILAVSAAVVATVQQRIATDARSEAESLALARTASDLRETNPILAMQLGVAAYTTAETADTRGALLSAVTVPAPSVLTGHERAVDSVVFGPRDSFLATGSEDNTAKLWNVTKAYQPEELSTLTGHTGYIYALAARGQVLATASGDGTVRLWDVTDPRKPVLLSEVSHGEAVRGVAFSSDGATLATGSRDTTAKLWDVRNPKAPVLLSTIQGHTNPVRGVAFKPDGPVLATTSEDQTARLWDISDPRQPVELAILRGHEDTVRHALFSPNGKLLATSSNDGTARLFDVSDPSHPVPLAPLTGHTHSVYGLAFSPDSTMVATGSGDTTTRLWDVAEPSAPVLLATLTGHTGNVTGVAFGADGHTLATSSSDLTTKVWNISDPHYPATLRPPLTGHASLVRAVAFSPTESPTEALVATASNGSDDHTVRLWNVKDPSRPVEQPIKLEGHPDGVRSVAFHPGGQILATGGGTARRGQAKLWNVANPREPLLLSTFAEHKNAVNAVAFSPDRPVVATASGDGTISLWNIKDPGVPRLLRNWRGHGSSSPSPGSPAGYVYAVAFSPDGRTLATTSEDNKAKLWDVSGFADLEDPDNPGVLEDPEELATLEGHIAPVQSVTFAPDGATLATASSDKTAKLWDIKDPRHPKELATLEGHSGVVWGVAFAPDGATLATASADKTARLWAVGDPGHPALLATLEGHTNVVNGVAFSPDGRRILTGSSDRIAQLWETDAGEVIKLVCATNTRVARQDWETALPGIPYRPPCTK